METGGRLEELVLSPDVQAAFREGRYAENVDFVERCPGVDVVYSAYGR